MINIKKEKIQNMYGNKSNTMIFTNEKLSYYVPSANQKYKLNLNLKIIGKSLIFYFLISHIF
jgi:hypothetical protein